MTLALALSWALTGTDLPLPDDTEPETLLSALAGVGWDAPRIIDHAHDRWRHDQPWPHPISTDELREYGPARFNALLDTMRWALDLVVVPLAPTNRTTLSQDEKRLMADMPPHHGNVG